MMSMLNKTPIDYVILEYFKLLRNIFREIYIITTSDFTVINGMVICCVIPGKISRYYYVIVEYFKPLRNIFHEMSLTLRYFTI